MKAGKNFVEQHTRTFTDYILIGRITEKKLFDQELVILNALVPVRYRDYQNQAYFNSRSSSLPSAGRLSSTLTKSVGSILMSMVSFFYKSGTIPSVWKDWTRSIVQLPLRQVPDV